jgi:hypothetical protein
MRRDLVANANPPKTRSDCAEVSFFNVMQKNFRPRLPKRGASIHAPGFVRVPFLAISPPAGGKRERICSRISTRRSAAKQK